MVNARRHTTFKGRLGIGNVRTYTRLQTVWSLHGHSRQANKGHSPRCHCRPNGHGRLADKVVQPTTQSAEGCTVSKKKSVKKYIFIRTKIASHLFRDFQSGVDRLNIRVPIAYIGKIKNGYF